MLDKKAAGLMNKLRSAGYQLAAPRARTLAGAGVGAAAGGYGGYVAAEDEQKLSRKILSTAAGAGVGAAGGAAVGSQANRLAGLLSKRLGSRMDDASAIGKKLTAIADEPTINKQHEINRRLVKLFDNLQTKYVGQADIPMRDYGKALALGAGTTAALAGAGGVTGAATKEMLKY